MKIELPYSKSILLRILALDYATGRTPAQFDEKRSCRDVEAFRKGLEDLKGGSGHSETHIEEGGAPLRFLLALAAWTPGLRMDIGVGERLAMRPVGDLLSALRESGAVIGFDPEKRIFSVSGIRREVTEVRIDATASSQFVSALMLAAPLSDKELTIVSLSGEWPVSHSYIAMTAEIMRRYGFVVKMEDDRIEIRGGAGVADNGRERPDWKPEADWSAAAFVLGLCYIDNGRYWEPVPLELPDLLYKNSLQGDAVFPKFLREGGGEGIGESYDLRDTPDLAMPLAATLLMLRRPFRFKGLETLPTKESDRLEAMRREFRKFGYLLEIQEGQQLVWTGRMNPVRPCAIKVQTDGDHRIALATMMMELEGFRVELDRPDCVAKSWPRGAELIRSYAAMVREARSKSYWGV